LHDGLAIPNSGSYIYDEILYSYQINGVTKYNTKMTTEYYQNGYEELRAGNGDQIYYQTLETASSPQ
jgi:hypothetical protein